MTQKCGGRPLTDEQVHLAVLAALAGEEKREARRLGKEAEDAAAVSAKVMVEPLHHLEAIVTKNVVSGTNSLSQTEWLSMEATMPPEERQTHKNLRSWMLERAKSLGVSQGDDDDGDADLELIAQKMSNDEGGLVDDDDEEDEESAAVRPGDKVKKEDEEEEEAKKTEKGKNVSSVGLAFRESKLSFRGVLSPTAFTNWMWYRCVRPRLEETKAKLPEIDISGNAYGIEDVDEILGEWLPVLKEKDAKKDKKDDKEKKDDKKGKKDEKDDKKSKKDDKKEEKKDDKKKDKKSKKDIVVLNKEERIKAQHLIRNMIFGDSGKGKTIVTGWVNMIDEKDIPSITPWEFQIAHVLRQCLQLEYTTKKKKENPNPMVFYDMAQALADAISLVRHQYQHELPETPQDQLLPLKDAIQIQRRFREGSVGTLKFDLLWYLQHGAHLISGSSFMKRHRTTVFKPFAIQTTMTDAIIRKGPQLVFGIAPPGTGKTAIVSHLLNLFPGHSLVFLCAALPVVLGVGRISNHLDIPYAFVKGRRLTPSYSCGRGLGTHVDNMNEMNLTAVENLRYTAMKMNLERKKKRLALKKRSRALHDLKRMPRMYLMCDAGSCAWLLRQLDPNRTILVVDEPPMGSDRYPEKPEENPLACAMMQAMMTPSYKTILMSATLPRVEALPTIVNSFLERFHCEDGVALHVTECFSTELDRGALMCGPSGAVAFPHQNCKTSAELAKLCARLPGDPLVLKAYTERALANLLLRWQLLENEGTLGAGFLKRMVPPNVRFEDLSTLSHASIRSYALEILSCVADECIDELVVGFCRARTDGERSFFPVFDINEMLFSNAFAYPGLTLVADDDPAGQMLLMSRRLQDQMPKWSELEDDIKTQEENAAKQEKYAKKYKEDAKQEGGGDEGEGIETQTRLKFSADLVIQSEAFLKRWCTGRSENSPTIVRLLPTVKEFNAIKELPVDERWQMLALSGAAAFDPKLNADPGNPVYTQWVHDNMTAHKLACVTAGKEFTWGANVPASTVVVTKSFAETTSVAGMLQYVGRAARRGLTTHGQAVFERQEDLDRIFASPDGLSTEALTMERYAKW